jgi:hypothetical protein
MISSRILVLQIVDESLRYEPAHSLLPYRYIIMPASILTNYVIDSGICGVTMRRKNGIRTLLLSAAAKENPASPPLEDEDLLATKKPRLIRPTTQTCKPQSNKLESNDKQHGEGARASTRSCCMLFRKRSKLPAHCTGRLVTAFFHATGFWVISSLPVHFCIAAHQC